MPPSYMRSSGVGACPPSGGVGADADLDRMEQGGTSTHKLKEKT